MNMGKTSFTIIFLALLLAGSTVRAADPSQEEKVVCPVCCKEIKKTADTIRFEYKGQTFYFASAACRETFVKEPDKYLKKIYTCPMHPEVQATEKGKCPKCGMFLEPRLEAKNCGTPASGNAAAASGHKHVH
jgi:YHS domain-containing protein